MRASILTIGDELLIGQVVNTNAAWLGDVLTDSGITVVSMITVADRESAIRDALKESLNHADITIVTGGLGPTHDDITKKVIADYFDAPLQLHAEVFEEIRRRFELRGIPVAESNRTQAMVPEGFERLNNPIGTAPGLWYEHDVADAGRILIVLPGVPREMKILMNESVLPRIGQLDGIERIERHVILTTGIGESNLSDLLGDLTPYLGEHLRLAYLPGLQGVRLRLTGYPDRDPLVAERMALLQHHVLDKADRYVFGTGSETLEQVTGKALLEARHTIAVAESCTGGLLLSHLTDVAGSSAYVLGGVVAYQNEAKFRQVAVDPATLEEHGAVSRQVVVEMARGVRHRFEADIGLATSGIMGPGGGTEEKPVGTVWIGLSDGFGETAHMLRLGRERDVNKVRSVMAALNMVRLRLLKFNPDSEAR